MRRGLAILAGVAIVIVVAWIGLWYAARYAAEAAIARVAAGGNGIVCASPALGGFPLAVEVRCDRVTYGGANGRLTAAVGGVAAAAPLYRPGAVDAKLDAPLVVNAPGEGLALTASWSLATAEASAWIGGLTGFGASFVSLNAENSGGFPGAPLASLTAANASGGIAPAGGRDYLASVSAERLSLVRDNGTPLPDLDVEARIAMADVGDTLGTDPAETILDWARNGGTARIERIKLAGVGALVTGDGALRLSDAGLLNGAIILRWNDIEALADLIEAILPGTRERVATPLQGLAAVSVGVETPDGPMRQTGLTFTDGMIWLGIFPLPIDPIPPIRF